MYACVLRHDKKESAHKKMYAPAAYEAEANGLFKWLEVVLTKDC